jgi:hypothetical protein
MQSKIQTFKKIAKIYSAPPPFFFFGASKKPSDINIQTFIVRINSILPVSAANK